MTGNLTIIGVTMTLLFAANPMQDSDCEIINGSFEYDGRINDITKQDPNGWTADVNSVKFMAKTEASWATDGFFSLNIASQWLTSFVAGQKATVSQQVLLTEVKEIMFDLKMDTYTGAKWNADNATAFMMIDDEVVWEPNSTDSALRGVHTDQSFIVEDKYKDGNPHTLSFGLRINLDATNGFFEFYRTWWDSIECVSSICDGGGLLDGDFNQDCFVDIYDLRLAADLWLAEIPSSDPYNLYKDDDIDDNGIINFLDLSILADNWLMSSYPE